MPAAVRVSSGENLGSMTPMDWECGIDSSSTQGTTNSLYFRLEAHLASNYRYRKYKNGIVYIDWNQDTPVSTVVGPINFINGDPVRTQVECFSPECDELNPCPDGEKCVDGECVPCEKLVDGKGIVTLWGVHRSDGTIMSDGLPVDISSGVATVQLSNFDPLYLTAGRIQLHSKRFSLPLLSL